MRAFRRVLQRMAGCGKKRNKLLRGSGLCVVVRSVAMDCNLPKWSWTDLNRRPPRCKRDALPTELQPHQYPSSWGGKWAHEDSNFGPRRYQRRALTN